jgi:N-acetylneuraminic acid mutarotase
MRRARHEFACAVLDDGRVYVVGGRGEGGKNLAEAEVYDPSANAWEELPGLRRPRWGCIGAGIGGKLYVMGGRSSFTIGHSRCVDVFDPATHLWIDDKEKKKSNSNNNGCTMVLAHAVLGHDLFLSLLPFLFWFCSFPFLLFGKEKSEGLCQ